MATKLYLTRQPAPYVPATIRGTWNLASTIATSGKLLSDVKFAVADTITLQSGSESVTTDPYNALLYRGISLPLQAQTIDGTLDLVIACYENDAAANAHFHVHAYITQGNSDTVRGTLLNDYIEALGVNELGVPPAAGKSLASAQTLSSVAVTAGDRLVVEVGFALRNSTATFQSYGMFYGTNSSADLTVGSTNSALPGYLSFSDTILIASPSAPANDACASATVISSLPYSNSVETRAATPSVGPNTTDPTPFWAFGTEANLRTVWYEWTCGSSGPYTATSSGYDTILSVWTGACGAQTEVASIDNNGINASNPTETLVFSATSGVTYRFCVGGLGAPGGDLTFTLAAATAGTPTNQYYAQAIEITEGQSAALDLNLTSTGRLWYYYVASEDAVISVHHQSAGSYDTFLQIHAPVQPADAFSTPDSYLYAGYGYEYPVQVPVVAGETYLIDVQGSTSSSGLVIVQITKFNQGVAPPGSLVFPAEIAAYGDDPDQGLDGNGDPIYRGYPFACVDTTTGGLLEFKYCGDPDRGLNLAPHDFWRTTPDGHVGSYLYDENSGTNQIIIYNPNLTKKVQYAWTPLLTYGFQLMVANAGDTFFFGATKTGTDPFPLIQLDADGNILGEWSLPNLGITLFNPGFAAFDVSPDGTIYYGYAWNSTVNAYITRWDLVNDVALPHLTAAQTGYTLVTGGIRVLPDGTILTLYFLSASPYTLRIRHWAADGTLLRTIDRTQTDGSSPDAFLMPTYDGASTQFVIGHANYNDGLWYLVTYNLSDGSVANTASVPMQYGESGVSEGQWYVNGDYPFTDPQFGAQLFFYQPFWLPLSAPTVPPLQRASYILFSQSIVEKQAETRLTKSGLMLLAADPPPAGAAPVTITLTEITGNLVDQNGNTITTGMLLITPRSPIVVQDQLITTVTVRYTVTGPLSINLASSGSVRYDVQYDPTPSDTVTPVNLKPGFWKAIWEVPNVTSIDVSAL
jgi:hypothetical protein